MAWIAPQNVIVDVSTREFGGSRRARTAISIAAVHEDTPTA